MDLRHLKFPSNNASHRLSRHSKFNFHPPPPSYCCRPTVARELLPCRASATTVPLESLQKLYCRYCRQHSRLPRGRHSYSSSNFLTHRPSPKHQLASRREQSAARPSLGLHAASSAQYRSPLVRSSCQVRQRARTSTAASTGPSFSRTVKAETVLRLAAAEDAAAEGSSGEELADRQHAPRGTRLALC